MSVTSGQRAYEAYCAVVQWKSWDGKPLRAFSEIPKRIQSAWQAAANRVTSDLLARQQKKASA